MSKTKKIEKSFEPVLFFISSFRYLICISESVFCIYSIFLLFNYSFTTILWPDTKGVRPPKRVKSVWIVSFINSRFESSRLSLLPFLVAPPCRSIWALSWLLSLGLLSFWSSLSTRWMMHSRDLSTFTQTFSWRDMGMRLCCHGNHIGSTTTSGDVCANVPTPLHANPCAARSGCCDRSTWPAACPGRCGGLLVPSRRRETFWRRCTRAVLRAAPEWLRPAAYSHTPWQADGSAGRREESQPLIMNMLYIQNNLPKKKRESPYRPGWRASSPAHWRIGPWRLWKDARRSSWPESWACWCGRWSLWRERCPRVCRRWTVSWRGRCCRDRTLN